MLLDDSTDGGQRVRADDESRPLMVSAEVVNGGANRCTYSCDAANQCPNTLSTLGGVQLEAHGTSAEVLAERLLTAFSSGVRRPSKRPLAR